MANTLEQKLSSDGIILELPNKRFSVLSRLDNIKYCIEKIGEYSINGSKTVIGYYLQRSAMGTKETLHRILSHDRAEELKKETGGSFNYFTLTNLLKEKKAYQEGKYTVRDGHFVGLNPAYAD